MMIFTAALALLLAGPNEDEKAYPMQSVLEKMQKKIDDGVIEYVLGKDLAQALGRVVQRALAGVRKGDAIEKIAADAIGDDAKLLRESSKFKYYVKNEIFNNERVLEQSKDETEKAKARQRLRPLNALKRHLWPDKPPGAADK